MSIGNQLAVIRRDIELFGREPNDAGEIIGFNLFRFCPSVLFI